MFYKRNDLTKYWCKQLTSSLKNNILQFLKCILLHNLKKI